MPQGTVKLFKMDRGFGFIKPDGGGSDVFVHTNDLMETGLTILSPGQKVTFDIMEDAKTRRLQAVNVRLAE